MKVTISVEGFGDVGAAAFNTVVSVDHGPVAGQAAALIAMVEADLVELAESVRLSFGGAAIGSDDPETEH